MALPPKPVIPSAPTPPIRGEDPTVFATKSNAFVAWQAGLKPSLDATVNYLEAAANQAEGDAGAASVSAASALNSRQLAELAANAAASAANATQWISGTSYTIGDVVWSPSNFLLYRRRVTGAGTTDPSIDPTNWALIGSPLAAPQFIVSANTQAVTGGHYIVTAAGVQITLPLNPGNRDTVQISNRSGAAGVVVVRNGQPIMSIDENLTIDTENGFVTLVYVNSTLGWIFQ